MQLNLKQKINGTILITFIFIVIIFSGIHFYFHKSRLKTIREKISFLLSTLVDRDMEPIGDEIFENNLESLDMRIEQMLKVKGIISITVFDRSKKILTYNNLRGDSCLRLLYGV